MVTRFNQIPFYQPSTRPVVWFPWVWVVSVISFFLFSFGGSLLRKPVVGLSNVDLFFFPTKIPRVETVLSVFPTTMETVTSS